MSNFKFISGEYDSEYFTSELIRKAVALAVTYAVEEQEYATDTEMDRENISVSLHTECDCYYIVVTDGTETVKEPLYNWLIIVAEEELAMAQAQRS